ncbi:MATH and LRR domain-containing protein PFE0570w-like [Diorhabda carinulata]|uniref:MATH and LRR domain-containing protein PFE0570w-like n=1 Tax=Diorhabda carinulata TaxID=1163345 RepID=UPI0025A19768|nr:MATH and LRR domain-containing protein PFE0570w-like [Diorhabda carinulata]
MSKPTETIQAEESNSSSTPLRRSCRIVAVSSPAISESKHIKGRRLSSNMDKDVEVDQKVKRKTASDLSKENIEKNEPAKTRTRRQSNSSDSSTKGDENKNTTKTKNSQLIEDAPQDTPKPVRKRRSSATNEEVTPKPVRGRRSSATSEEDKNKLKKTKSSLQDDKEQLTPVMKTRGKIDSKQEEAVEQQRNVRSRRSASRDLSEENVETKRVTRSRRSSTDMSDEIPTNTPIKSKQSVSVIINSPISENINKENEQEIESSSGTDVNKKEIDKTNLELSTIFETSFSEDETTTISKASPRSKKGSSSKENETDEKNKLTEHSPKNKILFIHLSDEGKQISDNTVPRKSPRLQEKLQKCQSGDHSPHRKCICIEDQEVKSEVTVSPKLRSTEKSSQDIDKKVNEIQLDGIVLKQPVIQIEKTNIELRNNESVESKTITITSDSNNKENMNDPNKSPDNTRSQTVDRVSNVFRPKDINYSFIEPMEVDTTINLNISKFEQSIVEKNREMDANETVNKTFTSNLSATYIEISEDDLVTEKPETNNENLDSVSGQLESDLVSTTTPTKLVEKENITSKEGKTGDETIEKESGISKRPEDLEKLTENRENEIISSEDSEKNTEKDKTKNMTKLNEAGTETYEGSVDSETMNKDSSKSPEGSEEMKRKDKIETETNNCSEEITDEEKPTESSDKLNEIKDISDDYEFNLLSDGDNDPDTEANDQDSNRLKENEINLEKSKDEVKEPNKNIETINNEQGTKDHSDLEELMICEEDDRSGRKSIDGSKNKDDEKNTYIQSENNENFEKKDEKLDSQDQTNLVSEDDSDEEIDIISIRTDSSFNQCIEESKIHVEKLNKTDGEVDVSIEEAQSVETPEENAKEVISLESANNSDSEDLKKENNKINEVVTEHREVNMDDEIKKSRNSISVKESEDVMESSTNPKVHVEDNDKTVEAEEKHDEVQYTNIETEELITDASEEIQIDDSAVHNCHKLEIEKLQVKESTDSNTNKMENSYNPLSGDEDVEKSDSEANIGKEIDENDEEVNVENIDVESKSNKDVDTNEINDDEMKNPEVDDGKTGVEESTTDTNKPINNATIDKNEKLENEIKDQQNEQTEEFVQMEDISIKLNEHIDMESSFQDVVQDEDTKQEIEKKSMKHPQTSKNRRQSEKVKDFDSNDSFRKLENSGIEGKCDSPALENDTSKDDVTESGIEDEILTKNSRSSKKLKRKNKTEENENQEDIKSKESEKNTSKTKQKKKQNISIEKGENFTIIQCVADSEQSKTLEDILGGERESKKTKDAGKKFKKRSTDEDTTSNESYQKLEDIIYSTSPKSSNFSLNKWFGTKEDKTEELETTNTDSSPKIKKTKTKSIDCGVALSSEDVQKIQKKGNKSPGTIPISTSKTNRLNEFLDKKMEEFDAEETDDSKDSNQESLEENNFIDDMAEEGEEDTPSEDSNAIIDEGESINSNSERSEEDDYESDSSFICHDEYSELLPGDEYDLDDSETKKKSRIINIEDSNDDVIKINRKPKPEPKKRKTRIIKMESSSESEEVVDITSNNENKSDTLKRLSIDKDRKSSRKSSITIIEDIKVNEIKDAVLSNRINQLVDTFCTTIPKKGGVSMNLSLEYAGHSSPETPQKSKKLKFHKNRAEMKESRLSVSLNENMEESKNTHMNNLSLDKIASEKPKKKSRGKKRKSSDEEQIVPCKELRLTTSPKEKVNEEQLQNESSIDAKETPSDQLKTTKKIKGKKRKSTTEIQTVSPNENENVNMEAKKKKSKKNHKPNKTEDKITPCTNNSDLQSKTFSLLNQLVTDVKNRSRRMMRPSTIQDTDENWCVENNVKVKPSTSTVTEKEKETFKKQKFHPKDFRNQMLYNSNRVNRVETKKILQKKGVYY